MGPLFAILYRNFLLFRTPSILLLLTLMIFSYVTTKISKSSINMVYQMYTVFLAFNYIPIFVFSMVDDRSNHFKSTFKVMGLKPLVYISAQLLSFQITMFVAQIIIFLSFIIFGKTLEESFPSSASVAQLILTIFLTFAVASFAATLSFLFSKAKNSKDLSIVFTFALLAVSIVVVVKEKFKFLALFIPFVPPIDAFVNTTKLSLFGLEHNSYSQIWPLLFQIVLYTLTALYFEQIWPGGDDLGKHPLFFLKWKKRQEAILATDLEERASQAAQPNDDQKGEIIIEGLSKKFGDFYAFKNISLSFKQGKATCLLG